MFLSSVCFVVDLLRLVVVLPTVSFFVVFVLTVQMEKFNSTRSSDRILFVNMLQIWKFKYFRHCWIIKCVDLKPILFVINMDVASSSKVFNTLDYVFLSIVFANLNQ